MKQKNTGLPKAMYFSIAQIASNTWEGRASFLDGEYVFASYLIRLSIRRDIAEPEYVNAYMNTRELQTSVKSLTSLAVGQSNISASSLACFEIPLPPLDDQRRLVADVYTE